MTKLIELQQVIDQIRSEIKVDENGVGTLSIRALARICDLNHKTLVDHFSGGTNGNSAPSKLCKILIEHGFETWGFGKNGVPDVAAYLVIDYYAHHADKNCTEFAKKAVVAIGAIGMRQWCREVTGWTKEESKPVTTDSLTVEALFSTVMEMRSQMAEMVEFGKEQVKQLQSQVEQGQRLIEEKQEVIDDMVEKENIREIKFLKYPGLKEATEYALNWDDEVDEEVFFTLKQFCEVNQISLSHGQKIQVGKMATDFCRVAIMRKLPKNLAGHTLYSSRFEPIVKLAIIEVLNLKR